MGTSILGYRISILGSDGSSYFNDLTHCDGSNAVVMAAK